MGVTSYVIKAGTKGRKLYSPIVTDVDRCCVEIREVYPGSGDVIPNKKPTAVGCLVRDRTWKGSK